MAAQTGTGDLLVVRGWGQDSPGIAEAFIKTVADHKCKVVDVSQFLLEGSLMFTLALQVADGSSVLLMKDLQQCAKDRKLQIEFHFSDAPAVGKDQKADKFALLSVVTPSSITPKLLHDIDHVLSEHGCVVRDIEHRIENKKEHNGEIDKVEMRINCPGALKLSDLYLGSTSAGGLQQAARNHGAEVTVCWWNALNRPNGKSLVVFGLSHVLCPCDVLDEVIREAGADPDKAHPAESIMQQNKNKVQLLKGKKADAIEKVIARLEFTPGARLVCSAMKRMGFRMAILTNTGVSEISEHVKRQLGIDYSICRDLEVVDGCFTGAYVEEVTDVAFRKADLLKLMADREGISYQNVIVVGQFLKGLKQSNAKLVLETFGPNVLFNSTKQHDLVTVLYQLGFNAGDIQGLRKRKWSEFVGEGEPAAKKSRFTLQVSTKSREPGQMSRILASLNNVQSNIHVRTVRQCSLQDGGMCLGMDFNVASDADTIAKELLFSSQKHGFQIMDVNEKLVPFADGGKSNAAWWQNLPRRHVITMVQQPNIAASSLQAVLHFLSKMSVNIVRMERLSVDEMAAMQFTVNVPDELDTQTLQKDLGVISKQQGMDIAFQKDDLDRSMRRMVVFDMDSTLIQQEVIDELAKIAGVEEQISKITEAAMNGDMDFFESLKQRVLLLKGHHAETLFTKVKSNVIYTPGAKKLCSALKSLGYKLAVISGGFLPVAQEVQKYLGLDYAFANTLETDENGMLTGRTSGPVVTPQRKRALLATIANVEGCEVKQTIAVGDGSNDIPMLHTAGLGIAFCAKPKVQAAAEFRINQCDLSTVLFLIGVSEHAANRLEAA